jgi:3-polyprenyl-4-hydroxybenzoate decarboxylase
MIDHTIGRVLDLFELDSGHVNRWSDMTLKRRRRPKS